MRRYFDTIFAFKEWLLTALARTLKICDLGSKVKSQWPKMCLKIIRKKSFQMCMNLVSVFRCCILLTTFFTKNDNITQETRWKMKRKKILPQRKDISLRQDEPNTWGSTTFNLYIFVHLISFSTLIDPSYVVWRQRVTNRVITLFSPHYKNNYPN